jgi:hypothetical protein
MLLLLLLLLFMILILEEDADADLADLADAGRCRWDARDKKATGTEDNQTIPKTCNNNPRESRLDSLPVPGRPQATVPR